MVAIFGFDFSRKNGQINLHMPLDSKPSTKQSASVGILFFYHVFQIYPQFSILNGSHEQMSNSESAMNTYIMFGNFYRVMKKNIGNQGMRETQAAESITCVCVGGEEKGRGECRCSELIPISDLNQIFFRRGGG